MGPCPSPLSSKTPFSGFFSITRKRAAREFTCFLALRYPKTRGNRARVESAAQIHRKFTFGSIPLAASGSQILVKNEAQASPMSFRSKKYERNAPSLPVFFRNTGKLLYGRNCACIFYEWIAPSLGHTGFFPQKHEKVTLWTKSRL